MGGEQLASITMLCHDGRKTASCVLHDDAAFLVVDPPAHSTIARVFDKTIEEYYGYCGIPEHGGREAVSPTLVGLVTLCSG